MDNTTALIITYFMFFGWIPILALGKSIAWIIEACTCSKCTCRKCEEEMARVNQIR